MSSQIKKLIWLFRSARVVPKPFVRLCSSPLVMGRPLVINAKLHKTKRYIVHGFEDPTEVEGTEEEKLTAFRRIRDQIKTWIVDYFSDSAKIGSN